MALRKCADGGGPDAGLPCLVAKPRHGRRGRQPNVQTLKSRPIVRSGATGLYLALPPDPDFLRLLTVFLSVQIDGNCRQGRDLAQSSATHDESEIDERSPADCRRNRARIWCIRRAVRRSNRSVHSGREPRFRRTVSSVPGSLDGHKLRAIPASI